MQTVSLSSFFFFQTIETSGILILSSSINYAMLSPASSEGGKPTWLGHVNESCRLLCSRVEVTVIPASQDCCEDEKSNQKTGWHPVHAHYWSLKNWSYVFYVFNWVVERNAGQDRAHGRPTTGGHLQARDRLLGFYNRLQTEAPQKQGSGSGFSCWHPMWLEQCPAGSRDSGKMC